MRLAALLFAGVLMVAPVAAQEPSASSPGASAAPPQETAAAADLPVSLDRIREGLKKAPEQPLLQGLDRQADFRVEVREKARLEEILKKLDFKSGPAPAGGLYGYEQQQRLFNPVNHPLMQPYAAFSGGELVTIAIQNLIANYLGKPLINTLTNAAHERSERAAKEEVERNVAAYCASRPDRWNITLCNPDR
jgi:hypothetical protein